MDLRPLDLSPAQVATARQALDYQPFIITDDLQTGIAYSWTHWSDPNKRPPMVFDRSEWAAEWEVISDSNARQRRMYDDWLAVIVDRFKGGTLLDMACNNGYFPVQAQKMGMARTVGSDLGGHYARSIGFLNEVLGTSAEFIHAPYNPRTHSAPIEECFDVVVASTVLYHLPDPTHYLAYIGSRAKEAVFFFDPVIDTEALVTAYAEMHLDPYDNLAREPFPYGFNTETRVSKGLFRHAMERMGFRTIIQLPWQPTWLPPYLLHTHAMPTLNDGLVERIQHELPTARKDHDLARDIEGHSRFMALLAVR